MLPSFLLSLFFGLVASCCCLYWGSTSIGLILTVFISLVLLQQNFSYSLSLLFLSSNIGSLMVFLSCLLCFLSVFSTPSEKSGSYLMWIGLLGVFLSLAFSASNVIMFYIFFEAALIPTLMLIIGWGYQPERLQAGSYMMLYTVAASLPLLASLIWRSWSKSSMSVAILSMDTFLALSLVMTIVVYGAFLVKLPMYSTHLWLPKAHVEAPLAGSMILAGILLKLGGYGLMFMNKAFSIGGTSGTTIVLISISVWGGFLATLMCLRQVDMKALVAYSSVGHMGLVAAGALVEGTWGMFSATVTMLAHGLSSPAMFCLTYFTYQKVHTRSLPYVGGFLQMYPYLSLWWFVFCCINMAAPPTLNLVGELAIVPCLNSIFLGFVVVMALMVFFSAGYNMFLYTSINHGAKSASASSARPMESFEMASLFFHVVPLALIFKASILFFLVESYYQEVEWTIPWITKSKLFDKLSW